jgi:hypothetical protein
MWLEIFWFCSISIVASCVFLACILIAKRIDESAATSTRRRSEPEIVAISPNETRTVRSVENRYVRPDSNLLRSGGYQPRPGNHRPAIPKTGSGVQKRI